jgi:hypothetical protein
MKRFVISVLCVSVFFVGLGSLADNVGAKFRSDEKAMDIIRKARLAIGGDQSLSGVRSMVIVGRTTKTLEIDGVQRTESGETQITMEFPNRFMKMVKLGDGDASTSGRPHVLTTKDVVVIKRGEAGAATLDGKDGAFFTGDGQKFILKLDGDGTGEFTTEDGRKIVVRKADGAESVFTVEGNDINTDGPRILVRKSGDGPSGWTKEDGETANIDGKHVMIRRAPGAEGHSSMSGNEMLRTALSLLLTAPEGFDVVYAFAGEGSVDGTAVNIVTATSAGVSLRLHIDKFTYLPVAVSYTGHALPQIVKFDKGSTDGAQDNLVFTRKLDATMAKTEFMVRFSDFRGTNGIQLPYRWTTMTGGRIKESFDITSYEINPANISERFSNQKLLFRTTKPAEK